MDDVKSHEEDPGRADYVPKSKKKRHARRFDDGDKVWLILSNIIAYVKQGRYDEDKDGWVYCVQEQDKEGRWYGSEKWKRETSLNRA